MQQIAVLAQQLLPAEFGVINILDGSRLVPIAASPGVVLGPSVRSFSLCTWVVQSASGPGAFICSDATEGAALATSPWVTGAIDRVRFYAAAPLMSREGVALGTLCVWSRSTAEASAMRQSMLEHLADRVVDKLDQRRSRTDALAALSSPPAAAAPIAHRTGEPPESVTAAAARSVTIDAVIRDGAIRTLFQPIVHLQSQEVVGFEALSRGPADTPMESPAVLIEAARVAGRLGELDWLCRAHAMEAVAASSLHRACPGSSTSSPPVWRSHAPRTWCPRWHRRAPTCEWCWLGGGSPFEILSGARKPERAAKQDLRHITTHLEDHAIDAHEAGVVLAALQHARFFGTAEQERYRWIAERNALTVVLGQDVGEVAEPRYRTASLLPGSLVQRVWLMIVVTPYFAAAFAARDCGDQGPDCERRFDYVYTHDPDLVIAAGRAFLQELEDGPVQGWFGDSSGGVLAPVGTVAAMSPHTAPAPRPALRAFGRRHR